MGRILAIDFGTKRTGLAVTDPLKIIATPLDTVRTFQAIDFLKKYHETENIEAFVIGMPKDLMNKDTDSTASVRSFINLLKKNFPDHTIHQMDERYTSKIAMAAMISGGMKKKDRQKKENVDKLSATIILQSYLESRL
ncbi:Holliday junction resolvase RuvX [Reichenbachiella carrageenanivorans]|uniref:Putative pre-16S rRNA nuclease n=1 Tax=Reichenbachiella carrageenanivorans TaxID=2979869 RepID=A0ABY6D2R9_9BACT|nr:Holliday junction resolvase RuvX [Reichenbachiella carrageenanivorans]UXX80461.1 Holliday junction resolvase RuvX [Reichenbachiella carrageenanivorans]